MACSSRHQLQVGELRGKRATYTEPALAVVGLAFQGGMTVYYLRRRKPVTEALKSEEI